MNRYRIRFATGPTLVEHFAAIAAANDRIDTDTIIAGTEHVHFTMAGDNMYATLADAKAALGYAGGGWQIHAVVPEVV